MKIKPILFNSISTKHTSYSVDFELDSNITFIQGDSGVGKSAVFSFLQEMAVEDKRIRCINYLDVKKSYKTTIKNSRGKCFVIDNADTLLDDSLRSYISMDGNNQYIIIGRNPTGLLLSTDEIYELVNSFTEGITTFSLKKSFV